MKTQTQKNTNHLAGLFLCISLLAIAVFSVMKSNATTAYAYSPSTTQVLSQMTEQECIELN